MVTQRVVVIGGGPAGLMAAEVISRAGVAVALFDAMPTVGRKFLMAGRGGLNLTHAEPAAQFLTRYGTRNEVLKPLLSTFGPDAIRAWSAELGIETFVGTSQRVFPTEMKATPLLRAWVRRLKTSGVSFHMRHRWIGWSGDALRFETPTGEIAAAADATVLALGGGSWARLGSDGSWVPLLRDRGVAIAELRAANCGFDVQWSPHFKERFAGTPIKPVSIALAGSANHRQGEFVVTTTGVEGGLIYTVSAALRDEIAAHGTATLMLDLAPGKDMSRLAAALALPRGKASMSTHLRKRLGIDGVKAGLLREIVPAQHFSDPHKLAAAIKSLPLRLTAARPLDEAISTAGGVAFEALDANLMLNDHPGTFCAGEMLDWEAPTGGYLLTACLATGRAAGQGVMDWLCQGTKRAVAR
ncbi:MAG: TIGR03862 family flavoprotein [Rhodospirillaceae bacterium]|nr:MAG: TIGR03862 family flavoprotein [Rhodospirillaceae bacterium]